MKGRITQPWTTSEDERLCKLAAEGRSSLTIAERMKRSQQSIRHRARKLNIVLANVKGSFPGKTAL
jgi:DNA-binding NarL/FixJ family response regulator